MSLDQVGRRLVVRNGYQEPREVATAAGAVRVRAPGVHDKRTDEATEKRKRFASALLPAWARTSPQVAEVLPLLYLHGPSRAVLVAQDRQRARRAAQVRPAGREEGVGRDLQRPGPRARSPGRQGG